MGYVFFVICVCIIVLFGYTFWKIWDETDL